ncbi:hypothetical protein BDY17DRAFT_67797 [Neohortaea acidophila]|uniref:Uncharacterized protein n=1 Tax=Neohortaea acidophila TaxID=245834 RepID=A0A6A6Q106_9PEZI|nr:uncharacterized protein BDY17DRAFT_67797 [Neohortaea acidophila]KAF2485945.1 hypothetical protein BDY17DRAFT_67797 [Neohortaea acidophila]
MRLARRSNVRASIQGAACMSAVETIVITEREEEEEGQVRSEFQPEASVILLTPAVGTLSMQSSTSTQSGNLWHAREWQMTLARPHGVACSLNRYPARLRVKASGDVVHASTGACKPHATTLTSSTAERTTVRGIGHSCVHSTHPFPRTLPIPQRRDVHRYPPGESPAAVHAEISNSQHASARAREVHAVGRGTALAATTHDKQKSSSHKRLHESGELRAVECTPHAWLGRQRMCSR